MIEEKASMYVPKYDTNVLIEFNEDLSEIEIDYIPSDKFTEKELKEEIKIIIKKVFEFVIEENK